jgi:hypothetical protein
MRLMDLVMVDLTHFQRKSLEKAQHAIWNPSIKEILFEKNKILPKESAMVCLLNLLD